MNVRIRFSFESITEEHWNEVRSLARGMTNDPASVRVFADTEPNWLIVDFTVPTDLQINVVNRIDSALELGILDYEDSTIGFPRTEAEQARADRKSAQRKAARLARKKANGSNDSA